MLKLKFLKHLLVLLDFATVVVPLFGRKYATVFCLAAGGQKVLLRVLSAETVR